MARKLSQEDVLHKIKAIHGENYDLSNVVYVNNRTKIEIKCLKHESFLTSLGQVLRGQGCPICGKADGAKKRRVNFQSFVSEARKIHGDTFEYDQSSYTKISATVRIKCKVHSWFEQLADAHIRQSQGCAECGRLSQSSKRKMSLEEFLSKAQETHRSSNYDYSNVNKYINNRTKVEVICPKHGSFFPSPDNHLQGSGCPTCGIEKVHSSQIKEIESFISDSIEVHGSKYDYSQVKYVGGKKTVQIICPKHGPFHQAPNSHQRGSGCPNCNTSKGEDKVKRILENLEISFKQQYTFKKLINKRKLKCDFFLPDFNLVIEYNGRQHYEPVNRFGGKIGLIETERRDQIKRDYFNENNINLLEIHYLDMDVEKTIIKTLQIE
jgi:hypothetical protein